MKNLIPIIILSASLFLFSCGSSSLTTKNTNQEQPVVIVNDSLEYEIIIFDIGFNNYLNTIAKPTGYHTQNYLEIKNQFYVASWNNRVQNISVFDPTIYENIIDYNSNINYGYEVNYKLFNYFEFAQHKYKMRLQ